MRKQALVNPPIDNGAASIDRLQTFFPGGIMFYNAPVKKF
jgi:hypothetical protein